MGSPTIEHLWSNLWATRFAPEAVRLRFELGAEFDNTDQQVPRFLQAHRRASTIADALFSGSCVGVVAWSGDMPDPTALPDEIEDGFVALHSTGFDSPQTGEWSATLYPNSDDDESFWKFRSYELGRDKIARDTLLWHATAAEMPIYPSAPVVAFLIDPDASVMLHVYDDRGMDVMAVDPAKLRGLYSDFADWLLNHDRERMMRLF